MLAGVFLNLRQSQAACSLCCQCVCAHMRGIHSSPHFERKYLPKCGIVSLRRKSGVFWECVALSRGVCNLSFIQALTYCPHLGVLPLKSCQVGTEQKNTKMSLQLPEEKSESASFFFYRLCFCFVSILCLCRAIKLADFLPNCSK